MEQNALNTTIAMFTSTAQRLPKWLIFAALAVCWAIAQGYYLHTLGLKIVPDSTFRYLPAATELAETGRLTIVHEFRYIAYIAYLSAFIGNNLGLNLAVFTQIAVSGLAGILLYKATKRLANGNRVAAIGATAIFILWKDVQLLNVYILTESLFISAVILVFYVVVRCSKLRHFLLALALSMLPALLRPNGFIVTLAVLAAMAYHYRCFIGINRKLFIGGFVLLAALLLLLLDNYLLTTFGIVESYAKGEVIYAADILSVSTDGVTLPPKQGSPMLYILRFIFQNPLFFLKLFLLKLTVFLGYAKPYYSAFHNLAITAVIYPLYAFSAWFVLKAKHPAKAFLVMLLLLQTLIVAFTSEDWDSRFIAPLLPVVMVFGVAGFYSFIKQKYNRATPARPAAV